MLNNEKKSTQIVFIIITIVLVAVSLFPLYWVARMSFTPNNKIFSASATLLPPALTETNFSRVLGLVDSETSVKLGGSGQKINFLRYLFNSVLVSTVLTVFQVLFSAMAAYAFARLRFRGNNALFATYVSALMIPGIVMIIPNFILMKEWGWLNTYQGIIAPAFLMSPFAVFFFRQFFLGINREMEEAAFMDGAGKIRTFFQIIVPISQTALATLAIITFITQWNDYLWPLIVGKEEGVRQLTVALGIFRSQTPQGSPDWGGLMAGTFLALLPILALFLAFGKRVINAIGFSGFR